jgi:hypothetical protein
VHAGVAGLVESRHHPQPSRHSAFRVACRWCVLPFVLVASGTTYLSSCLSSCPIAITASDLLALGRSYLLHTAVRIAVSAATVTRHDAARSDRLTCISGMRSSTFSQTFVYVPLLIVFAIVGIFGVRLHQY